MPTYTFPKNERLTSRRLEDELFASRHRRSATDFPLRAVWLLKEEDTQDDKGGAKVQLVVAAPKKRLHHAVDRNRAKRQMREAWRLNSQRLKQTVPAGQRLVMALIWTATGPRPTTEVFLKLIRLTERIEKDLCRRRNTGHNSSETDTTATPQQTTT